MDLLTLVIILLINLLSFVTGARIGQKIVNNERIEVNPVKAVQDAVLEVKETAQEQKAIKAKEEEDEYFKTIYHNIDVYDGTSVGQKPVPIINVRE